MSLIGVQIYDLVRRLSVECEGMVSYRDFRRVFQSSVEEMESRSLGSDAKSNFAVIPPKPIPELVEKIRSVKGILAL